MKVYCSSIFGLELQLLPTNCIRRATKVQLLTKNDSVLNRLRLIIINFDYEHRRHSVQYLSVIFEPVKFSFHGVVERMELCLVSLYYCELVSHLNYQLSAECFAIILLDY